MKTTTQQKERIERLIGIAEQEARSNPKLYNAKVALLALLGYAVIFGALFLLVSILGGISWVAATSSSIMSMLLEKKIFIGILVLIYVLARALLVSFDSPSGYELKTSQFPILFQELNLLTRILRTPKIHQVILTTEYNAGIVQTPRFGVLGWYKNTLYLGLELLMSMSPQQARAVLAHELGHLSGKHCRFSGWIYRVRLSWQRIMESLGQHQNMGADLLRYFFNWYSPTFTAYSFALARANEYNADKIAAKLTTSRDTADALVNSHVGQELLNEYYWKPYLQQANAVEQPDGLPYSQLMVYLSENRFDRSAVLAKVNQALAATTGLYDTHPALKDRLDALNCEPVVMPKRIRTSAAKVWFGKALPDIINDFDAEWMLRNASKWHGQYKHSLKCRSQMAALKAKPAQSLSTDELWQLAQLTEEFEPNEDCLPLYEQYSKLRPNDAEAEFVIGRLLLARNDEKGVDKLTDAMGKQPNLKPNAYDWLINFYQRRNDLNAAKFWQEQSERLIEMNKAADTERRVIAANDPFIRPDRHVDIQHLFTNRIMNIKGLKKAWLSEKRMRYYPDKKTYVLIFERGLFESEKKIINLIKSQLDPKFNCFVMEKNGKHAEVAKQAIQVSLELF